MRGERREERGHERSPRLTATLFPFLLTVVNLYREYALLPNSLSLLNRDLKGVDSKKEILGRNTFGGGVTHLCTFPMTNPSLPGEECF
mmetsp:Transcript_30935/g.81243  ORF Transcript_30935/g.81243 Transcript_30935/m.81243 type:complete len:88 (+) Transcript_30935:2500-2763(+)